MPAEYPNRWVFSCQIVQSTAKIIVIYNRKNNFKQSNGQQFLIIFCVINILTCEKHKLKSLAGKQAKGLNKYYEERLIVSIKQKQ